jgi:hypothetical protein
MIVERPRLNAGCWRPWMRAAFPWCSAAADPADLAAARVESLLGGDRSQYLDFSAAMTTPERAWASVTATSRIRPADGRRTRSPGVAASGLRSAS